MRNSLADVLPDLPELLVFGSDSVGLPLTGTYTERSALVTFEQGNVEVTVRAIVMDVVVLYFAYNVGTNKVCPKLRDVRATLT